MTTDQQIASAANGVGVDDQRPTAVADSPMWLAAFTLAEAWGAPIVLAHYLTDAGNCSCWKGAKCASPAKHPIDKDWPALATADPDQLRRRFAEVVRFNIGIATGRIVVLDVDGPEGEATLTQYPALPHGPRAKTARGFHAYFLAPAGAVLRNRVGANGRGFGKGVDLRADGGFVIVPPSVHASGVAYEWIAGCSPADVALPECPDWIIERAADQPHVQAPPAEIEARPVPTHRAEKWAQAALDRECNAVRTCPPGERNDVLNLAAFNVGTLIAGGALDAAEARAALTAAGLACGLPEFETAKTIRSGMTAGAKAEPRSAPSRDRSDYDRSARVGSSSARAAADGGSGKVRAPIFETYEPPEPPKALPDPPPPEPPPPPPLPRYEFLSATIKRQLQPLGQRLPTGIATLDKALRGGLPMKRRVVLQGPPGSCKTSVAAALAYHWAVADGIPCVWLAADETAAGVVTRLGQLAGQGRDGLESEGPVGDRARAEFAAAVSGVSLVVLEPDEGVATIEDAAAVLEHLEPDGPRVLIVDSLQTARCAAALKIDSPRERIDAKLDVLSGVAKRGTLIVTTSEVSRAGYRSKDSAQNADPLAVAKESGSIEYSADVLLSLSNVRGEPGLIDVVMPKNRLGQKLPFRLRQDFARANFEEVELPDPDEEAAAKQSPAQRDADARALASIVVSNIGCNARELRAAVKGLELKWSRKRLRAATERLKHGIDGQRLINTGSKSEAAWTLQEFDPEESTS